MLYLLEAENIYSIKEKQTVDLRVSANVPNDDNRLAPAWEGSDIRVPKVVAFFGANAAGKSNVLKALSFLFWFAGFSARGENTELRYMFFNDSESANHPTTLAIEFGANLGPSDQESLACKYRYEFSLSNEPGKKGTVIFERLTYWPNPHKKKTILFERNGLESVKFSKLFNIGKYKSGLLEYLEYNKSLISTLAKVNHEFSFKIFQEISLVQSNILIFKSDVTNQQINFIYDQSPDLSDSALQNISRLDVGIENIFFEKTPNGPLMNFKHQGQDWFLPLVHQSHGTQQFLKFYPIIHSVLDRGGIAIVDELDMAIHPMVLPEILNWFHSKLHNPKNAQIWLTAQNPTLLEDLTKEEIYFCEKDYLGETTIYGLKDIDKVRREDNYYKKYLSGVYGAVPHIG